MGYGIHVSGNRITRTFEEVKTKRTKVWKENGKRRQKTKTFSQTLNPFNKNAEGNIKTREEILVEINAEADAWMNNGDL